MGQQGFDEIIGVVYINFRGIDGGWPNMFLPQDIEEMCSIEKCPTGLHENQSQAGASTSTCSLPLMPVQTHDGASDGISRQDGQLDRSGDWPEDPSSVAFYRLAQLVGDQLSSVCISYGRAIAYRNVDVHGCSSGCSSLICET